MSARVKDLANWILSQLNDDEIIELKDLLITGTIEARVNKVFTSDVSEFLVRAEAACLTASYQVLGDSKVLQYPLNTTAKETASQEIQSRFKKLFLDGPV